MIESVEIFLSLEIREFNVGHNCKHISETIEDGIHIVSIDIDATATNPYKEIIYINVPCAIYYKK